MYIYIHIYTRVCAANPTWGDIFECCFKAQSSKLDRLFSLKRGKRDVRALSFELPKMTPQVGLALPFAGRHVKHPTQAVSINIHEESETGE